VSITPAWGCACSRDVDAAIEHAKQRGHDVLRSKASTLRAAADAFQQAGDYHMAEQIRSRIPR
jgi:hypothetical protein